MAFDSLPRDLVIAVGSNLNVNDIISLGRVCRRFGLEHGPVRRLPNSSLDPLPTIAEESARRALENRPEYFRRKFAVQCWQSDLNGTYLSFMLTLKGVDNFGARLWVEKCSWDVVLSDCGRTVTAASTRTADSERRFFCCRREIPWHDLGTPSYVEFTLANPQQQGHTHAWIGVIASRDCVTPAMFPSQTQNSWFFHTYSGRFCHGSHCSEWAATVEREDEWRTSVKHELEDSDDWDDWVATGSVKAGSVVGMQLDASEGTLRVWLDGKYLGIMAYDVERNIGDFRWGGILSAGAQLHIDGPKTPPEMTPEMRAQDEADYPIYA